MGIFGPGKPSNVAATLKVSNQVSKLKRGWAQDKVTKNTSERDKFVLVPLKIVLQQPRPNSPLHPNSSTSREAMPNIYDPMGPNWSPEITKNTPKIDASPLTSLTLKNDQNLVAGTLIFKPRALTPLHPI